MCMMVHRLGWEGCTGKPCHAMALNTLTEGLSIIHHTLSMLAATNNLEAVPTNMHDRACQPMRLICMHAWMLAPNHLELVPSVPIARPRL